MYSSIYFDCATCLILAEFGLCNFPKQKNPVSHICKMLDSKLAKEPPSYPPFLEDCPKNALPKKWRFYTLRRVLHGLEMLCSQLSVLMHSFWSSSLKFMQVSWI